MRLTPSTDIVPAAVNKYLLPSERQVITIHRHPAALIAPITLVLLGLATAGSVSQASGISGDAVLITWLIWVLLVLYLIGKVLRWSVEYYSITTERIVCVRGFFSIDVAMLPLVWTADMKLRRSAVGRLVGYGQLIFAPRHQDHAFLILNFVPYPEQIYLEISALIFPDREAYTDAAGPTGNEPELARAQQPADEVNAEHDGRDKDEERGP